MSNDAQSDNRPHLRRVALLAVALLLVASLVTTPISPVGDASAVHDCDTVDAAVSVLSGGYINHDKCTHNHVDHAIEEMDESDADQTKTDIYSAAAGQKAQSQSTLTVTDNYLNDTDSVAWMHAEKAIAKAYKNGKSKAEAKIAAKEAIEDYYAIKQRNLAETWNVSVAAIHSLDNQSDMEDGISSDYVHLEHGDDQSGKTTSYYDGSYSYVNRSVTLANGSTVDVRGIDIVTSYEGDYHTVITVAPGGAARHYGVETDGWDWYGFNVNAPDDTYSELRYMEFAEYHDQWTKIENQTSTLQSEVGPYVDSTWDAYEEGRIDASDVMSRTTLMFEQGVDATNSSGMYNVIGGLAAMGLETPDLNESGYMTVQMNGQTYEGLLLGTPPNSTWTTNTTYNASNFSGPVQLATVDGGLEQVDGEFIITEMTDKQGNSINSIETREYVYQTSDASELISKMEDMRSLRVEIEQREPALGGSSDLNLDGIGTKQILAILAVLAGLALVSRRGKQ